MAIRLAGSTLLMAAGILLIGWWAPPLLALGWAVADRAARPLVLATGAALGWAGLLAWQFATAPAAGLTQRLGGIIGVPGWGLILVGPLLGALLAWSGATVGTARWMMDD